MNFDPQILTLIRETDCMTHMCLEIPPFASVIQQKRDWYKKIVNNLQVSLFYLFYLCVMYIKMSKFYIYGREKNEDQLLHIRKTFADLFFIFMTVLRHFQKGFVCFVFSVKSLQRWTGLGKLCRAWERDEEARRLTRCLTLPAF